MMNHFKMTLTMIIVTALASGAIIGSEKERKPDEVTAAPSKSPDATLVTSSDDCDCKHRHDGESKHWKKRYGNRGGQYKALEKKLDKILADLGTLTEKVDALQKKS
jgi:hypothetical protein